ncbi:hypothetical protein BC833DRAFT_579949 [Globomyces pollinis-pini]|nr:hypothetical protein BC833DRAFT_579949 [Globomyces pollinis-pini]
MSWKREHIPDHKFDFVDVDEFYDDSLGRKLAYLGVFAMTMKDVLVYMADLISISILLVTNKNGISQIFQGQTNATFVLSFNTETGRSGVTNNILSSVGYFNVFLIILSSLILSFVLLAMEWNKALTVIESRDISYAFTSIIASRYYVIRSYPHYCLFSQIQNSRKPVDILAFWVFFKFKGSKRLLFAEFPRQFFNALIVIDIYSAKRKTFVDTIVSLYTVSSVSNGSGTKLETTIFFTLQLLSVTIWIFNAISVLIASIVYVPLVCRIQGNLKEYCVHKIDKRIDEILKRKTRRRRQDARRQERERINNTTESEYEPTLPTIDIDIDKPLPRQFAIYPQDSSNFTQSSNDSNAYHGNSTHSYYNPPLIRHNTPANTSLNSRHG